MKIETDDLLLFGSLAFLAIGAALVTGATTGHVWLSLGVGLMVYGLPSFLVIFMAASEEPT